MSIDGVPALHELSPLSTARSWGMGHPAAPLMPPVTLIHGTADKSVPHDGSHQMSSALRAAGCDCSLRWVWVEADSVWSSSDSAYPVQERTT